jgi:hypothetical protein
MTLVLAALVLGLVSCDDGSAAGIDEEAFKFEGYFDIYIYTGARASGGECVY